MLSNEPLPTSERNLWHQDLAASGIRLTAYNSAAEVPADTARALLVAHMTWAHDRMIALGAPEWDALLHVERFFEHFDDALPPRGAYFLAHDAEGHALGTGALRRVAEDTAEMKHLYVLPEARGHGLGEALIVARIAAARNLGIRKLMADTFRGNDPMIRLYQRLGFSETGPYESAAKTNSPELAPHLRYFCMEL